jgi:uncharacterized protein YodC (DUF2158 family)
MHFQIGDVVQLKSGGPYMTIENFSDGGNAFCVWFDGTERKTGSFNPRTLMKAE